MVPLTSPADAKLAPESSVNRKRETRTQREGRRIGAPFRRVLAPRKGRARRQVSWLADRHPSPPSHAEAQWQSRDVLPAYSGGTAWASHPLRLTAGQSGLQWPLTSVVIDEYTPVG